MAGFFKRLFKGVAAVAVGGPAALFGVGVKKAIQKRRTYKKSVDNLNTHSALLITGEMKKTQAEINKSKARGRSILAKMREAKKLINRGHKKAAALSKVGISEKDINETQNLILQ